MGADSVVFKTFWALIHTEMNWTELSTMKLADGKSVPLLEAVTDSGSPVWLSDTVITLKHTKPGFI